MSGKYSEFIFNLISINSTGILLYLFFDVVFVFLTNLATIVTIQR